MIDTPTCVSAENYDSAFAYFNFQLFGGALPAVHFTLSASKRYAGYYRHAYFVNEKGERVDEIGMNPEAFQDIDDYLSTIVHEMCHQLQQLTGTPGKGGYHNRQWANSMMDVGLKPINLENEKRQTGRKITHEIVAGGRFDVACKALLATQFKIRWLRGEPVADTGTEDDEQRADREEEEQKAKDRKEKKLKSKTPYHCPSCLFKAWAKPQAKLVCGDCMQHMEASDEPQQMEL